MATDAPARIHELDFCDKVASWANSFFANADSPFNSAGIEGFGTGELRRKRKDLRFYDRSTSHLAITGEVRLPGAKGGESPYDPTLMGDAEKKAENANVQYFFTWNVNVFVLFDRSKWKVPLVERRVREWRLDRHLRSSEDVARTENLEYIRTKFLPDLLLDLGRIYRGQAEDWPMAPDDIFIRSLDSHLSWPIDTTRAYLARQARQPVDLLPGVAREVRRSAPTSASGRQDSGGGIRESPAPVRKGDEAQWRLRNAAIPG